MINEKILIDLVDLVDDPSDDEDDDDDEIKCWSGSGNSTEHDKSVKTNKSINADDASSSTTHAFHYAGKKRSNRSISSPVDDSDSDDDIVIMDPPDQNKQSTIVSRKIQAIGNRTLTSSSSSSRKKSTTARGTSASTRKKHNLASSLHEDDDDDDTFWEENKPSGLSRNKSSMTTSTRNTTNFQSPTSCDKLDSSLINQGVSENTNTTSLKRGHDLSSLRNPYKKGNAKTPVDCANLSSGNPHSSSSTKKKIANPYTISTDVDLGGVCYPILRERTKMYEDLRPNIILALWKYARKKLVHNSYTMQELDRYAGRIVDLAVASPNFPIRSIGEYSFRKRTSISKRGCGGVSTDTAFEKLKEALESTGIIGSTFATNVGIGIGKKYFSIAEACLVAMKDIVISRWKVKQDSNQKQNSLSFPADEDSQLNLFSQKEYYVSLTDLIPEIDSRLHIRCPSKLERINDTDHGAAYYLERSTRSIEFKQIDKLLSPCDMSVGNGIIKQTSYIKKRMLRGLVHYQLNPLGFRKAVVISKRMFPTTKGHFRSSNLVNVMKKYEDICLAVDFREGGGGSSSRRTLHEMCNVLDMKKIPYFVATLRIGDYSFFSKDNKLCPILVERKSVQDVAQSIHDGRWESQKRNMYHGQFVFGYNNCRMAYIIEGKIERQEVSGGYIGNARFQVRREKFDEEISNLESEGFGVIRTCHHRDSMSQLATWAESVAKDVRSNKLKLKFTYNEFIERVSKIPKETDFSRLARYHAAQRKEQPIDLSKDEDRTWTGSESTFEKERLKPIELDETFKKNSYTQDVFTTTTNNKRSTAGAQNRFNLDDDKKREATKEKKNNPKTSPIESSCTNNQMNTNANTNETTRAVVEYHKWTTGHLKNKCTEFGIARNGTKDELIARLLDETNRPPEVYLLRKNRALYVPARVDVAATAILVTLQIKQDLAQAGANYAGETKDEIVALADPLNIKKDPWCGGVFLFSQTYNVYIIAFRFK